MKQLFLLEDDMSLISGLSFAVKKQGYEIDVARTTLEADTLWENGKYDLAILDVSLPDGSGFDFCKKIRSTSKVPIMFLTAADEETDIIMGLDIGGDDYITKPFSIHSLQRKVENVLRMMRHHVAMQDVFDDGRLFLNFAEQTAMLGGKPLTLSTLEFRMLNLFCQNRNRVLTRKQLLEKIWDCTENYVDEHTLTTTLSRIRGKIETDGTVYIKTVYGMGYKWTGGETA